MIPIINKVAVNLFTVPDQQFKVCDGYFGGDGKTPHFMVYFIRYLNPEIDHKIRMTYFDKGTHQPRFEVPKELVNYLEFEVKFADSCKYFHYDPRYDEDISKLTGVQNNYLWEHFGDCCRIGWRHHKTSTTSTLQLFHYSWINSTSPQVTGFKGHIADVDTNKWYRLKIIPTPEVFDVYFQNDLVHRQQRWIA